MRSRFNPQSVDRSVKRVPVLGGIIKTIGWVATLLLVSLGAILYSKQLKPMIAKGLAMIPGIGPKIAAKFEPETVTEETV